MRQDDSRAIAQGKPTRGPRFIRIGANIVTYRISELDAWLAAREQDTNDAMGPKSQRLTIATPKLKARMAVASLAKRATAKRAP